MGILIGIAALILLIIMVRIATRRRRNARKIRKQNKKRARGHHGYNRTVGRRGPVVADTYCPDCGLPKTRCKRAQSAAEHPEGMLGKKK